MAGRSIFGVLLLVSITFGTAQNWDPAAERQKDLSYYTEVTPLLGTGGQPTLEGLRRIAENGYKAVVNLRGPKEPFDLAAEQKLAAELGLKYYGVPVTGDPTLEQAKQFLDVMNRLKDEKVFVHCATANRAGAMVMISRVLRDGLSLDAALAEAKRIGLRSEKLLQFALSVIKGEAAAPK
jgi:protein tyrosine phosphatase (PTP) superfamily phosphohydrolase (DUF442 family)